MDWLTEFLAVGGSFPVEDAERLVRVHAISHVVDMRAEACDEELTLARHGMRLLHLPTEDKCAVTHAMLARGVKWVRRALVAGRRVLIHCQHGIGRSPLLALCVLVEGGMAPLRALELAKEARAAVSPSPDQLHAFIDFVRRNRSAGGAPWLIPSFGALASIAYRHLRTPGGAPLAPAVDDDP